ncbi:hypothetical protein [Actinoplanes sp. NBRC 103695]|uniref:hypothetical protein n=1 Tax=Actinoplanes sp. NBRC 103695 TaxID=3032202 RepID=UPI002557ABB3|nr:hypothetical protein [Actinoplanes sp. NBRC 103695]
MVFLAGDRDKIVVSDERLVVPGGAVTWHGPIEEARARGRDQVDVPGSSFRAYLVAVAVTGLTCAVALSLDALTAARVCGLLLLAATVRAALIHRHTSQIAARLRDGSAYAISDPEDRATFTSALTVLPAAQVEEIGALLRRRQRLREIRAELDARGTAGLPPGCLEADREHRARTDELWAETEHALGERLTAVSR